MSSALALCAAFCNALFVAMQHIASTSGRRASATGLKLAWRLLRSPMWMLAWAAGIGGFLFQAAALDHGQLSLVQAVLVTELVFGLALRTFWLRQRISRAAWAAAALTCVGLAGFVLIDQPHGGVAMPSARSWVSVLAVFGGGAAAMALAARWGSPRRRAALYATAAAIVWALEATFIKTATETLTDSGLVAVFTRWQVYAVATAGLAGVVLVQAALHVGPLSVSQPLLTIVDPTVSVILSLRLFEERFTGGPLATTASLASFALMCVGVVALTRTAPSTMRASPT